MLNENLGLQERITIRKAKAAAAKSGNIERVDLLLNMPK